MLVLFGGGQQPSQVEARLPCTNIAVATAVTVIIAVAMLPELFLLLILHDKATKPHSGTMSHRLERKQQSKICAATSASHSTGIWTLQGTLPCLKDPSGTALVRAVSVLASTSFAGTLWVQVTGHNGCTLVDVEALLLPIVIHMRDEAGPAHALEPAESVDTLGLAIAPAHCHHHSVACALLALKRLQ